MSGGIEPTRPLAPKDGKLALMVVSGESVQWFPLAENRGLTIGRDPECEVFVDDASLSRRHAGVSWVGGHAQVVDLGSSNGSTLAGVPLPADAPTLLPLDALVELGATVVVLRRLSSVPANAQGPFARATARALRAATGPANVLLLGEAGVGKRTIAERMHTEAARDDPALQTVTCAELDRETVAGWSADEHTWRLLLRVSETPPALQGALAGAIAAHRGRTLMTSRVDPAELARSRQADGRLVRAMQTLTVVVPALRECGPEVAVLAQQIAHACAAGLTISKQARANLVDRPWAENLRELQRVIESASAAADGQTLDVAHLEADYAALGAHEREKQRILGALRQCGGNQTSAAKALGLSRRALVYRLDKYGIVRPRKPSS